MQDNLQWSHAILTIQDNQNTIIKTIDLIGFYICVLAPSYPIIYYIKIPSFQSIV